MYIEALSKYYTDVPIFPISKLQFSGGQHSGRQKKEPELTLGVGEAFKPSCSLFGLNETLRNYRYVKLRILEKRNLTSKKKLSFRKDMLERKKVAPYLSNAEALILLRR